MTKSKEKKSTKAVYKRPPMMRSLLRPVDKALIHNVMFDIGIVPIEDPHLDMRKGLDNLSVEDATKMKRKFRKLWRKKLREIKNSAARSKDKSLKEFGNRDYGVGKTSVSKAEKLARKRLVYESVWNQDIAPKLYDFEHPDVTKT